MSATKKKSHSTRAALSALVERQANDPALWFVAQTAPEAYLQKALRELHRAIEESPAVPDLSDDVADPLHTIIDQPLTGNALGRALRRVLDRSKTTLSEEALEIQITCDLLLSDTSGTPAMQCHRARAAALIERLERDAGYRESAISQLQRDYADRVSDWHTEREHVSRQAAEIEGLERALAGYISIASGGMQDGEKKAREIRTALNGERT